MYSIIKDVNFLHTPSNPQIRKLTIIPGFYFKFFYLKYQKNYISPFKSILLYLINLIINILFTSYYAFYYIKKVFLYQFIIKINYIFAIGENNYKIYTHEKNYLFINFFFIYIHKCSGRGQ
ncbi:hypothetical protein C4S77_10765 [Apibacter adventoris]|uniref:Uncharacterized protein n=1 Tax=Apibacter adventoris TaxID=1679466 RepID=A0A2S8A727_9FLAO|nr:hypothetical protein C4S77_10765 [Apibacter adventoris]